MDNARMFRVIVVGGIALVGACGGSTVASNDAGFPSELGAPGKDASADSADTSFPSELPAQIDAGIQDTSVLDAKKEGG